jgi:hypothetical protein
MSFMSFEYARQAADAALQFHQNQGQNIKSVQDDVKSVGNGNAQRKNENMRNKIEAEYNATSAEIKKKKAESMMKLKEDRMNRANDAANLVLLGTLGGGMLDGIAGLMKGDERQMADEDQIAGLSNEQISPPDGAAGYATSFQVASGGGNSEVGAVVSYSPDQGNFSVMGVNTTTGNVTGFQNVSQTEMARSLLATAPADSPVRGMLEEGPPPAFKREFLEADGKGMKQELKDELFGDNGFFAQGSRAGSDGRTGSDAGENLAASFLEGPITEPGQARRTTAIGSAYKQSAESALGLLRNPKIQQGLNIDDKTVKNTENIFKDRNAVNRTGEGLKNGFQKVLFKPLGTSLNQFMQMHQVAKQYEEEYQDAKVEYEAAKRQAAAAQKKLQRIESVLAAGTSASA